MLPNEGICELLTELNAKRISVRVLGGRLLKMVGRREAITPELIERVTRAKADLLEHIMMSKCQNCGSTDFRDFIIHSGRSIRRDCANCKKTIGFPEWNPEAALRKD